MYSLIHLHIEDKTIGELTSSVILLIEAVA